MTTTKSTTDTIIHGMNLLSLNHNYEPSQEFYRDNGSEVTVTSKSLPHLKNDWLEEQHEDTYKHNSIIQSYLEPMSSHHSSTTTIPVVNTSRSKYAMIKSRVKRVFRISKVDKQTQQASLPVFSANQRWSSPSMDSMCSSTTTAAATVATTGTGSNCSIKKPMLNRNSCGFSTASFTKRSSHTKLPMEKNIKSCLKVTNRSYPTMPAHMTALPTRPTSSVIDNRNKKRWSSIIVPPPKKRFSEMMMLKKKQSSEMLFTENHATSRATITSGTETETETETMTRGIQFNKYVIVHETWSRVEYDRSPDPKAVCTRLDHKLAQEIKLELNYYKVHDMVVHDSSRINTHFFL
ncbi:hypothetical protein BD770DRAFT_457453 [Pilaira anomala]|nr:hypothetical protein BD770DRAFT_457453 [Pilaira anomala]